MARRCLAVRQSSAPFASWTAFPNNPNGCKAPEYWFWAAEASKVGGTAWGLSYCNGFTGFTVGAASGVWNYFPTARVRCARNGPQG
jgi:hypothetical protein